MGEDMLMNLRLAFASSKPVRLVGGNSVYNYIQHGGNITHVFKLTADYEHIFHKERLQAIPEEEHARYMPVMIYRRLRMLRAHSAVCAKRQYGWRAADFCFCERADCRYPCYPLCILALSALEALAVSRKCGEIKRNYTLSFSHSFNAAATVSSMSAYVYCASLPPNSTLSCCCASS